MSISKKKKLDEVSRNEMLATSKLQTITRYKKAAEYKGFTIADIDTTSVLTTNSLRVTCRVGNYWDTVELEDILYWIQLEAEKEKNNQVNTKAVTRAIMDAIDGTDIKVDCSCPDFCLKEDTKIKLLDGNIYTIKDLKQRFDNNEELWVYSVDEKGDFKPGKVLNVWISGTSNKMIKVTLDNDKVVETTSNHLYMLRDGSYKRADELTINQSLMSLYFNISHNSNHKIKNIEIIEYKETIPVYDIEVENFHNFYVEAGVILHNCYRFAYKCSKYGCKYGKQETRPAKKTNPNDYRL